VLNTAVPFDGHSRGNATTRCSRRKGASLNAWPGMNHPRRGQIWMLAPRAAASTIIESNSHLAQIRKSDLGT
jgi:hypothetical protein